MPLELPLVLLLLMHEHRTPPKQPATASLPAISTCCQVLSYSNNGLTGITQTEWSLQVHEMMGVTEKVPRVGGRELDLHMLYR